MRSQEVGAFVGALWALASPVVQAQSENPGRRELRRRALGDAVVLGNDLYIEGGEISQNGDSSDSDGDFSRPFNTSLSLPLDSSWKTGNLEFTEIKRGDKPNNKFNSLWPDEENNRIYQWDGEGSKGDKQGAKEREVWVMEADGEGGGKWTAIDNDEFDDQSTYSRITRNAQSAAVVCNGTAYSIGGFESSSTDDRVSNDGKGNTPTTDMYTFELESQTWGRSSIESLSPPNGVFIRAKAACVPGFGEGSLVFTTGGAISSQSSTSNGVRTLDATNVTFYDPLSEKWLWQEATGEPPNGGRQQHCMIGVSSPSGSYEIFVFGGYDEDEDVLDDMWILTIPGFHWIRVDTKQQPRVYHNCVATKTKQMIVVGGLEGFSADAWPWREVDEFQNGVAVFDLTGLEWRDEYDAEADEYTSPESVKKWYNDGGLDKVEWSSDAVKKMFGSAKVERESSSSSSPKPGESGQGNSESDPNSDNDSSGSSSTPTGAIAGGVVGGVAALGILGALIFCLRRRRLRDGRNVDTRRESHVDTRREKKPDAIEVEGSTPSDGTPWSSPPPPPPKYVSPSSRKSVPGQVNGGQGFYEMPTHHDAAELDTSDIPGFNRQVG